MLLFALYLRADTIDRLAVAVGNRVITTSDIERQIRISSFLSGTKPDLSAAARRQTAQALVDQTLVRRELETSRYPEPDPAELDQAFADFQQKYFKTSDEYRRALAEYGITEADVKQQLHWQRTWIGFVDVRFRPAVQVTDRDVQDYFDKTVAPAARATSPESAISLEDFRERILARLSGDRADEQMNQWLTEARRRTSIVYHEEAFR